MESSKQSFAQKFNTWIPTIGFIIATIWGIYTFVYKEMVVPKSAPVNITLDLQLKKIGFPNSPLQQEEDKSLIAIEMSVSATNPSTRNVYLLPSMWVAYGLKVYAQEDNPKFVAQVTASLNSRTGAYAEKHALRYSTSPFPVAIGDLFPDQVLKPNERTTQRTVFHIPPSEYDLVELHVYLPSMGKENGAILEWKFDEKNGSINPIVYRILKNGERKEMGKDKDGSYTDKQLELQSSSSSSVLSLWQ